MTYESLRARHDAGELTAEDWAALTEDELRVLALDEVLYGRGLIEGTAPAEAEYHRRHPRGRR